MKIDFPRELTISANILLLTFSSSSFLTESAYLDILLYLQRAQFIYRSVQDCRSNLVLHVYLFFPFFFISSSYRDSFNGHDSSMVVKLSLQYLPSSIKITSLIH